LKERVAGKKKGGRKRKKKEEERIFMKLFWKKIKVRKPTFSYRRF
jgi:hypothetical protein